MDEDQAKAQAAKQRRLAAILAGLAARGIIILGTSPEELAEKLTAAAQNLV